MEQTKQFQSQNNSNNFFDIPAFKEMEKRIFSGVRRELNLFKFELIYPQIVSEQERGEIEEEIINIRDKKWKKALKKTNGDEKKALMLV